MLNVRLLFLALFLVAARALARSRRTRQLRLTASVKPGDVFGVKEVGVDNDDDGIREAESVHIGRN